jgi:hypothetical protein
VYECRLCLNRPLKCVAGSNNYERYKAWFNLPALLGLSLQSSTITSTSVDVAQHSMANELHALVHAAKCLALAQQAAANKVLPCGSTFLHPEAEDQASSMLACFAKVAATSMYLRYASLLPYNMPNALCQGSV